MNTYDLFLFLNQNARISIAIWIQKLCRPICADHVNSTHTPDHVSNVLHYLPITDISFCDPKPKTNQTKKIDFYLTQ